MAQQYLRQFSLVAADDTGNGIELNDLAVKFYIHHGTYTFPHTADIYIYNLSSKTQNRFVKEFTKVRILAGYEGNYGVIFQGAIKQVTVGAESTVDGFTKIFAADGDRLHNFGVVNRTLQAGYTQEQVWATIAAAAKPYNQTAPLTEAPSAHRAPRGKVMYGLVRQYLRDWADTNQQLVTVDNGMLTAMPLLAFKPGEAVVINSKTGMVGVPEQTEEGITVQCLLNPAISWGTRLLLDNESITRNLIDPTEGLKRAGTAPLPNGQQLPVPFPPSLSPNGFYKALAVDHIGETRGKAWYTEIICMALDPSSVPYARGIGNKTFLQLGEPSAPGT